MALARTFAIALLGVAGHLVEVEAHLANGLPGLTLIGLPDTALHEARDRVRAAVVNSGFSWPNRRITLGLSPATLPKSGSAFDVSIAAAILAASDVCPHSPLERRVLIGELGLDGRVRAVAGVLPAVLGAVDAGLPRVVVPVGNVAEARLVPGAEVEEVGDLTALIALLRGRPRPPGAGRQQAVEQPVERTTVSQSSPDGRSEEPDLAQVAGQAEGRRAVEIAAAGGHHVYLLGPPGTGKTMLAERLPGLLPPLEPAEALEVTAVHSVAGVLPAGCPLVTTRPFRDPHHTATVSALVGGGSGLIRPGLASEAHRGVLFLDEAPEFSGGVLDALRQPLENGIVRVARARAVVSFPARFTLVLAANPCQCGRADTRGGGCTCTARIRHRYLARLSGPLLDRVDLRVRTHAVTPAELRAAARLAEPSVVVRERVLQARGAATERLAGTSWKLNAEVPGAELRRRWPLPRRVQAHADACLERGGLTARGLDRVLRVAWTIADLGGREQPAVDDVGEALALRVSGVPA